MPPLTTLEKNKARELKAKLGETVALMRADMEGTEDYQFAALCETSSEVLVGLITAIEHYEAGEEKAWR